MLSESIVYQKNMDAALEFLPDLQALRGKNVLITGASGMIGSALADMLLYADKKYGYCLSVYAIGRSRKKLEARFCSCLGNSRLQLLEHNVMEPFKIDAEIDYIVHAAGNAHPAVYASDPVGTLLGNVDGVKNMLELARQKKAERLVYVSSGEVYGQLGEEDIPICEEKSGYVDPVEVRSCYPSGKRAAETLCAAYARQYGVDAVVVRPSHVYGPTASAEDSRASTQFISRVVEGQDIVMKSDGLQQRSYCYVVDCASAILAVMLRGRSAEAYNIANPDSNVTIREFAEKASQSGGTNIVFEHPEDSERQGYTPITRAVLDSSKLMGLGWKGLFGINTGINDTIKILKEVQLEKKEKIKLAVWGTGGLAANTLSYNDAWLQAVDIVCFVNNGHKAGEEELFHGKPIVAPEELLDISWDYIIIFSSYLDEIREQIVHELKLPEERIVSLDELAEKVMEQNGISILDKDVLLYGEDCEADNYIYHIRKRARSLRLISHQGDKAVRGIETIPLSNIGQASFDYILLLSSDGETEEKLLKQIADSGYQDKGKILRLSQWSCSLASEHRIIRNPVGKNYYAIVGRPTWGLMALFTEFMRASAYAYSQGYIPFIDMQYSANMYLEEKNLGLENAWEYYFTQPEEVAGKSVTDIYEKENVVIPSKFARISRNRDVVKNRNAFLALREVYHRKFQIQDVALEIMNAEYQRIFQGTEGNRILGALYRGTDYKSIQPANHFVQPELDEFAQTCKKYMEEWECGYIFVATEDADALKYLKDVFGEKLLYTSQQRYRCTGDKFLFELPGKRENDRYLRGIEYLQALYCLSKCNCIVSGRNGGLNGVLILKEGEYEKMHIFEKGKYSDSNRSFNQTVRLRI